MRFALAAALMPCLALSAQAQVVAPPMDMGPGIVLADGKGPYPPACPASGSVVQRGALPAIEYLGPAPGSDSLCRMRVAGAAFDMFYGIWAKDWPGSADAARALQHVIASPTGTAVAFDVRAAPGLQWHEVIRNDGIETLRVAGLSRPALKISHYREGFEGNGYRSVTTGWKDMATGMMIYVTYRHISGVPEAGTAWDATGLVTPQ